MSSEGAVYDGPSGEFIRDMIAKACAVEDERGRVVASHEGRRANRNIDGDGYLLQWNGAPMTWAPYWEQDYYGVNATHRVGYADADGDVVHSYSVERDVETRLTLVDPMTDVPDNAHWKGWVW